MSMRDVFSEGSSQKIDLTLDDIKRDWPEAYEQMISEYRGGGRDEEDAFLRDQERFPDDFWEQNDMLFCHPNSTVQGAPDFVWTGSGWKDVDELSDVEDL